MNQILFTEKNISSKKYLKSKKNLKKFKIQFYISLLLILCSTSYFIYITFSRNSKESLSKTLLSSFNVERIYSNNNYTTVTLNENSNFFVIGIIEIPKINIQYPILSNTNDELLKISPCKFYGPYPNEIGNLCIAAHNYDDSRFFSNLNKLSIGDSINIYDSTNQNIVYYVYDKFEIVQSDTSCTNQNTNGKRELTLVTCNNINKNRLVIKAKE